MDRYTQIHTLTPQNVKSQNGSSNRVNAGEYREGVIFIKVTAKTGNSPVLEPLIEVSPDGQDWALFEEMDEINDIGNFCQSIANFGRFLRVSWELSGTNPTFNFSIIFVGKE